MEIRDAVEADAERMAELSGSPPDVMRNLVHDRTVRVAETPADGDEEDGPAVTGFVSFDARESTVHVTQIGGSEKACARLIDEPVSFARREGMNVEVLLTADEEAARTAIEDAGFEDEGPGPQFEGQPTTRYRLEPGRARQ
ncbi:MULTISPECIES: hypothetical protein [Halomicrobium]|uniref:N-acetyltransferase domain-containing protein n=2 Tax=Halomicrobium mukohataei TaxID=57705 RepID=C7NZY2_HALMD|nr:MULTISPECIES: hypothetical protein [Halomicrobium]ACV46890.1 conserved hypothetical protein [Halomicrobium mukohataei DSM 12286]QCD65391.1 hypothetical protein E5139_06975 [Halomicrobium mukohataei]QFR20197.1 hypothetical protein GBQ70_06970 [Halomicrobium sp. ZPS1]